MGHRLTKISTRTGDGGETGQKCSGKPAPYEELAETSGQWSVA